MDDIASQYQSTRTWFEYANGQAYNSNGWAIAAAFAIFIYVMKDAKDRLMVGFGTVAAVFLVLFSGLTAAGWAKERDAAYSNLVQLEAGHRLIVSQDPTTAPQGRQRTGTFGSFPLDCTIYTITFLVAAGLACGGLFRCRSVGKREIAGEQG